MNFIDIHCHIQFNKYQLDPDQVWQEAKNAGVTKILVVGCDLESSINAVKFAKGRKGVYAVVGIHPHEATNFLATNTDLDELEKLLDQKEDNKIVGIGEFGLDYYYNHSKKSDQLTLLKMHIELVIKHNLPAMFHIRDAFEDFWQIYDDFNAKSAISGVVHCFSATNTELQQSLSRGLYVALNGIMTFTKDQNQLDAAKNVPIDKLLLETDAPFLTPMPFRGKICKPEHVVLTAEFLARLRGETIEQLAGATTKNAIKLFNLN